MTEKQRAEQLEVKGYLCDGSTDLTDSSRREEICPARITRERVRYIKEGNEQSRRSSRSNAVRPIFLFPRMDPWSRPVGSEHEAWAGIAPVMAVLVL